MIHNNLESLQLAKIAVEREKCNMTTEGALIFYTGDHTGRSPEAKRIVNDKITKNTVDWKRNKRMWKKNYLKLKNKFIDFKDNNNTYLQDVLLVRNVKHSVGFRIYTEFAKHSLFVRNMFVTPEQAIDIPDNPDTYQIFHFPTLLKTPTVVISPEDKTILISGTEYSGEIKKAAFTLINLLTPEQNNFLPMHCSVNVDKNNENVAIFFGLSGTGKTTLSSHPGRIMIGDDEHLWTDEGVSNIEGGCYAKTYKLSENNEPEIWNACETTGTILENVYIREDGEIDFNDGSITENGRASYSTDILENSHVLGYINKHPKNIIMLTCDAFGVLPPLAKLSTDEAVKHFLMGYTAKVAGTEKGVLEPQPTFSPCFGGPFMPLPPERYADILKQKIEKHNVACWLVNTGWTKGPYGEGKRIPLNTTRHIIDLILSGTLNEVPYFTHKHTKLSIPMLKYTTNDIMFPEQGWKDVDEYIKATNKLMKMLESK